MAGSGPALVADRLKVSFVPSAGVVFVAVFVIVTFAPGVGSRVAEAFGVPLGSGVVWDSVAVLVIVPVDAFTLTVIVAVGVGPTARVPIVQVTVLPLLVIVPVEVAELT